MKTFRNWLISEGKDIFGFGGNAPESKAKEFDLPVKPISADLIMESLMGRRLDDFEAFSNFHDHVQWGRHPGAVQMVISPLGSFKSIIRRLQTDLLGESVWICKKIMPYKEILDANEELDEEIADEVFNRIEECWKGDLEAPSGNYSGLERLTVKVAEKCRSESVRPKLMVFRGVRAVQKDRHYNIHFEMRGQGVEAPGSARVEQFSIEMAYDKDRGLIRSFGHDIQSPTRGHLWYPQPSEWDEVFSPAQSEEEIISVVASAFSTY